MRAADLGAKRVAIWGLGREGRAAIQLLRRHHPDLPLVLFDDAQDPKLAEGIGGVIEPFFGKEAIARAIPRVEVIVKSPGVSLYRPEVRAAREMGVEVTSLLNLWCAEPRTTATIFITGTKGKSTTASLLAHLLSAQGKRVALAGNIGVAISDIDIDRVDFVVVEVSSYQAADFTGIPDVALLTALFPEHLDWHGSVENYYRDKLRLLMEARCRILPACALVEAGRFLPPAPGATRLFGEEGAIHAQGGAIFNGDSRIGEIANPYLRRRHNASNLCAALTAFALCGGDLARALAAAADFSGLPHRQKEIGRVGGVLAVDDSISTTPESALAALEAYDGRDITVILGGQDRGIDYGKLVAALLSGAAKRAICLGAAGRRICAEAARSGRRRESALLLEASSMAEAVGTALALTPKGGVILLSPAAPSYGQYRDFIERGRDFAHRIGLPAP
jgi:UDP-N-acetylmuramoyl-L-alanine---L-glutamate ligase